MIESTRRPGRPSEAADPKPRIIRGVVDLVAARGLHGWSMRDLAAEVGLSTGTINYHFRNRRQLLLDAMDSVYVLPVDWQRYERLPVRARLTRMARIFVLDGEGLRRWWKFWLAYMSAADIDEELRTRHEARYSRQRRFFARLLAAGREDGELAFAGTPDEAAERLLAFGNGVAVQQLATPNEFGPVQARRAIEAYLESFWRND
ncbi:MAG TPA: TetR/AcrR family transcriptional regulator [Paracoccaceae bacterium]|nr:TetR/AcrR family transcriptional regulator [Paracoccaceae bacterium]